MIARLRCPSSSVVVHTFEQIYLQDQLADCSQNISVASLGWGKGCIRFLGRSDQNCGYHGNRKLPLTYNGKNAVSAFSQSPLIGSLSNLQVMRTGIKSQMSLNFDQVRLFTTELFALEWSHWLRMGKMMSPSFLKLLWIPSSSNLQVTRTGIKSQWSSNLGPIWPVILELHALERWKKLCLQLFSVTFDWIFVKLAGNEDRHNSSNKFEFGSDRFIHFGVICPWARNF